MESVPFVCQLRDRRMAAASDKRTNIWTKVFGLSAEEKRGALEQSNCRVSGSVFSSWVFSLTCSCCRRIFLLFFILLCYWESAFLSINLRRTGKITHTQKGPDSWVFSGKKEKENVQSLLAAENLMTLKTFVSPIIFPENVEREKSLKKKKRKPAAAAG